MFFNPKFGTPIGSVNTNISIKFGVNLIKIQGVISDFMHKAKLSFCHSYRVNCYKEQVENRDVAKLNIKGVPFDSKISIE